MNKQIIKYTLLSFLLLLFFSCKNSEEKQEKEQITKVQVKTTSVEKGFLPDYLKFTGKTIYLNKSTIVSPINGYFTKVNVKEGSRVRKGDLIFEMQSPEAFLMQQNDSLKNNYGAVKIYASSSGIISGLNVVQKGVYSDQNSVLCLIIGSNDLKVQVNLPFEYRKYAKIGSKCKIILPDSTEITGTFSKILPQMNETAQTVKILANLQSGTFIPENLLVEVLINKASGKETQILPKNCLQTDALMTKFWVMKLINDTTAIQIPVTVGNQNHDKVEIISPKFNPNEQFISEGAYGLEDTVLIEKNN